MPFCIAVFSALIAALLGLAANTYFQILNAKNDLLKDYLEDLKEIEKLSISYWLGDHKTKGEPLVAIGVELRARLNATGFFRELARKHKIVSEAMYPSYKALDDKLYDAATGGNFQTVKMDADQATADEIVQVIAEIRMIIRESKISRYWAH